MHLLQPHAVNIHHVTLATEAVDVIGAQVITSVMLLDHRLDVSRGYNALSSNHVFVTLLSILDTEIYL
jgi:hypothetical protein